MNPMLAGMAVSAVGKLVGGGQQQKYAKRYRMEAQKDAENYKAGLSADQKRALEYRADDEARLKAATGYDFKKLRDDAVEAGFNPLTILQATGGAGYDGRGAVLASPFISIADGDRAYLEADLATAGAVIDGAGYVGDAIAGLGQGLVDYGQQQMQMRHEAAMLETSLRGNTSSPGALRGTRVNGGVKGRVAPLVGGQTAVPGANVVGPIFQRKEWVFSPSGQAFEIDASWMRRNGYEPGDFLQPGDYEQWLGESGQAVSLGYSTDAYGRIAKSGDGAGAMGAAAPLAAKLLWNWASRVSSNMGRGNAAVEGGPQYESWGGL